MDLSTTYLGLNLKNPVVVASCGLTKSYDQIKKCEDAGAAAVVMKSIFEEQIRQTDSGLGDNIGMHPEAMDYVRAELDMQYGPREYLKTIEETKKKVSIPIIASVNCYTPEWWTNYAGQLELAGADALELNIYVLPFNSVLDSAFIERTYLEILKFVKEKVRIPVSLKLSPYFTALAHLAEQMDKKGADGLVLFNRFIQPDINIDKITSSLKASFDDPIGFHNTLRWIALLSGKLTLDLAAGGNIKSASDVIKQILAGATVVQIASLFYKEGLGKIEDLITGLQSWMTEKGYSSISDFRGKLNQHNAPQDDLYIRGQYIKTIAGIE